MEIYVEPGPEQQLPVVGIIMKIQRWLSEITVVMLALLMTAEVVCRDLFNFSLLITDEVGGYFLVALAFLGMGAALHDGALFRVTAVLKALPERARAVLQLFFDILSLAFAILLSWEMWRLVSDSYARHVEASSVLATPLYIPQIVMVVGAVTMALVLVAQCAAGIIAVFARKA